MTNVAVDKHVLWYIQFRHMTSKQGNIPSIPYIFKENKPSLKKMEWVKACLQATDSIGPTGI